MARVGTPRITAFGQRLKEVLLEGLNAAGIPCAVEIERIQGTKLHRVTLVSRKFSRLQPSERQDLVWRIISRSFKAEEQFRISIVRTLAHDDLNG